MNGSKKLRINNVGKYSVTRPYEASQITSYIIDGLVSQDCIITDATAGFGGDAISFASKFNLVQCIEIQEDNFKLLEHNCKEFDNVKLYFGNCMDIIPNMKQDIIYMDPPWGGIGYKNKESVEIILNEQPLYLIIEILKNYCTNIFIKLPLNVNIDGMNIKNKYIIYNKKNLPSFYLIKC